MTKQLGPGVRVRSGWSPDERIKEVKGDPRLLTGTVVEFDKVCILKNSNQFHRFWWVKFDGWDREISCVECILTPIDDDNETKQETQDVQDTVNA